MRLNLPGQLDLPQTESRLGELAKIKAAEPLRPTIAQKPLDIGLFSENKLQIDLIEMLMD